MGDGDGITELRNIQMGFEPKHSEGQRAKAR